MYVILTCDICEGVICIVYAIAQRTHTSAGKYANMSVMFSEAKTRLNGFGAVLRRLDDDDDGGNATDVHGAPSRYRCGK